MLLEGVLMTVAAWSGLVPDVDAESLTEQAARDWLRANMALVVRPGLE
jgi:hypothetical protein